ncbi:ribonuclease H-like domain-containing protein, partial [Coprinopsis sp. MPI-PUGE-AT-0042]
LAYTDGSCVNNGTASAKAGSGVWYCDGDERNRALRLPDNIASNNTGELLAALTAICENQTTRTLTIISDSRYTLDALMKHIPRWADEGFVRAKNTPILRQLYWEILTTNNVVFLKKVKGHSGDEGNDAADGLAATGS